MMDLKALQNTFAHPGEVQFISIRPHRNQPVLSLDSVMAVTDRGLAGDHYNNIGGSRQVTLFQWEHLQAISSLIRQSVEPDMTRRNIIVKGLNLLALKSKQFQIGDAIFEYSGECHPCSRMETEIGVGAYNAMRGHGGITAKVIQSGAVRVGDTVCVLPITQQ